MAEPVGMARLSEPPPAGSASRPEGPGAARHAPSAAGTSAPVPLVVDLDGTLCATDTLHEGLAGLAARDPLGALRLVARLGRGKAAFKRALADRCVIAGAALPYRREVLDLIAEARAAGRPVHLVSAAEQRQVSEVAAHLGLFDDAVGTGGPEGADVNLGGAHKAAHLVARFGAGNFDYVGDATADLAVWAQARRAITVGAAPSLRARAEAACPDCTHAAPPPGASGRLAPWLRAVRPHQWSKNLLVFLPMLAAHDVSGAGAALAAFAAFCLTASSVYLINDMLDLPADRGHPRKRLRPFAAGEIAIGTGLVVAAAMVAVAVALAAVFTPPAFLLVLGIYYVATFAYSLWLKRKLTIDVLTLATLYTLRIIGGAAAVAVPLSPWMMGFSIFIFLSLAAVKRQAELMDLVQSGKSQPEGRADETDDLPVLRAMAMSAGYAAVLVFALYVESDTTAELYAQPIVLWLICPLLIYWISRMVMVTHRGHMTDDPIVYAARDRVSQITVGLGAAIFIIAGMA